MTLEGFKGSKSGAGGLPGFTTPQLQNPLTDKEAKEFKDKIHAVYVTVFKSMDQGITATNRDHAPAVIWSDIDDEDISVLVEVTLDGAKRSKIVATGVRQVARAHNLLRVGLITGPRFLQTVRHYGQHGGFILPFGMREVVPLENHN